MQLGIIGLPNSGKTTVFNALTRGNVPTSAVSTGRLEIHTGVVSVPDERIDRLSAMFRPRKTIYAQVTYSDIGGLEKGISAAGGLPGSLRTALSQVDGFVHVIRAFENEAVPHPEGNLDPGRDFEIVENEFMLADLVVIEKRVERMREESKKGAPKDRTAHEKEMALLERLRVTLEAGRPIRSLEISQEEQSVLRGYGFLSQKPMLILLNIAEEEVDAGSILPSPGPNMAMETLRGQLEAEIAQLEPDEAQDFLEEYGIAEMGLNRVIRLSYNLLGLISFFTVGEDEVRAWTIHQGEMAVDAAAAIHTDLAKGFIRAEVVSYDDLIAAGSLAAARTRGTLRLEGKEYPVKDGDIVHIRSSL